MRLAPLFGGGFGAGAIVLIVLAVLLMLAIMLLPTVLSSVLVAVLEMVPPIFWVLVWVAGPLLMAALFVQRRLRAIQALRLVIADDALTFCAARAGCRALRWSDVEDVEETLERGDLDTFALVVRGSGRRFIISQDEIEGYSRIRLLLRERLGDRLKLHPAYGR